MERGGRLRDASSALTNEPFGPVAMNLRSFIFSLGLLSGAASPLSAQWVVVDPTLIAQEAANQATNLAKYVEMVNHQLTQIDHLARQLSQIESYNRAFGNPDALRVIGGAGPAMESLREAGISESLSALVRESDGTRALNNTGNGLYEPILGLSCSGIPVPRNADAYKRYCAVECSATNFTSVVDDIRTRRERSKVRLAETVSLIQDASTASEVQKLQGVLSAQSVELQSLDQELNAAAAQTVVQDIANRTNFRKNEQAQAESIAADRHDALVKFGALTAPDVQGQLRFGRASR
ncbi:MAG: hypothetical protein RLZZ399_1330 [Verrucomicrobiota bacterium]